MRLYLSSFKFGNRVGELVRLAGPRKRAVIVMNALDNFPDQRGAWLESQREVLASHGFDVAELDLRDHFGDTAGMRARMADIEVVWANGGNAFILRRAMRQSGFDTLLRQALDRDEIVYAGFSAGSVVCAPSLRGLDIIDKPEDVPAGYNREVIWDGLGLVPFSIAVHFRSDHAEAPLVEKEIAFFEENGIPYRALRDGQALVVVGDRQEIVGGPSR